MSILNQNLLTLDFWLAALTTLCQPLTEIILMLGTGNVDVSVFPTAEKSLLTIIRFLQKTATGEKQNGTCDRECCLCQWQL